MLLLPSFVLLLSTADMASASALATWLAARAHSSWGAAGGDGGNGTSDGGMAVAAVAGGVGGVGGDEVVGGVVAGVLIAVV